MGPWTKYEDGVLEKFYSRGGAVACAPLLPGRTLPAIRKRANLRGLVIELRPVAGAPKEIPAVVVTEDGIVVGNLRRQAPGEVAADAARRLARATGPVAVTVDPDGRVRLELPEFAAEVDLVGVYDPELGLVAITTAVRDDLNDVRREWRAAA